MFINTSYYIFLPASHTAMGLTIKQRKQLLYCGIFIASIFMIMTTDFRRYEIKKPQESDATKKKEVVTHRFSYRFKRKLGIGKEIGENFASQVDNGDDLFDEFSYPINNERACIDNSIDVVIPVHSALTNPRRRNMTRHAKQGMFARKKENRALLLFFVGVPSTKIPKYHEIQQQIQNESDIYGDIIQVNITDAYHNIVFKAISVLQWVSTYCRNSEYVIKIDDDVHIDPPLLLWSLYKIRKKYTDFILGELRVNIKPERSPDVKWNINEEEWPKKYFPPFVLGPAIGYTTSTVCRLHKQARKTQAIWLDDVFITGICSQLAGIPVLNDTNFCHVHRPMLAPHFVYAED